MCIIARTIRCFKIIKMTKILYKHIKKPSNNTKDQLISNKTMSRQFLLPTIGRVLRLFLSKLRLLLSLSLPHPKLLSAKLRAVSTKPSMLLRKPKFLISQMQFNIKTLWMAVVSKIQGSMISQSPMVRSIRTIGRAKRWLRCQKLSKKITRKILIKTVHHLRLN